MLNQLTAHGAEGACAMWRAAPSNRRETLIRHETYSRSPWRRSRNSIRCFVSLQWRWGILRALSKLKHVDWKQTRWLVLLQIFPCFFHDWLTSQGFLNASNFSPCSACYLSRCLMPERPRLFSGQIAQQPTRGKRRPASSYYSQAGQSGQAQVTT